MLQWVHRLSDREVVALIGYLQRLGKRTAPSTVYNLLRRHGWRKLAPDRVHPQGNPPAQRRWKKKVAAKTG